MNPDVKSKIDEISKKFNAIEEASTDTEIITDVIETIDTSTYSPEQVMQIKAMSEDFENNRKSLIATIDFGKIMLEKLSQKLLLSDEELNPEDTEMFRVLSETVLNCTKASSYLYSEFSKVLLNIKKIKDTGPKAVTNNLNITSENISTVDLIEKLKNI